MLFGCLSTNCLHFVHIYVVFFCLLLFTHTFLARRWINYVFLSHLLLVLLINKWRASVATPSICTIIVRELRIYFVLNLISVANFLSTNKWKISCSSFPQYIHISLSTYNTYIYTCMYNINCFVDKNIIFAMPTHFEKKTVEILTWRRLDRKILYSWGKYQLYILYIIINEISACA